MTIEKSELSPDLHKAVEGFIAFVGNPNQTEAVFDIADGLRHTDLYGQFIEYAYADTSVAPILKERYLASEPDLETLIQYPKDSLGKLYADVLKQAQLDPHFYRSIEIEDDYSYLALRMRQTHDIWHIVTGLGTDLSGELALQAFTLAQTHSPLSVALLSGGIAHLLKVSGPIDSVVSDIYRGWSLGVKAKPFLAQKWEEAWEKPLEEWRQELNVTPMPIYET
jgi:ubiquinone biosynthesis protein COQ4